MSGNPGRIQIPPHSIEAEQSVLGGLILDNSAWTHVEGSISAGDFYRHDHRLIFRAIATLAARGDPYDVVTLAEYLKATGAARDAGGMPYLGELVYQTPSAANIAAYTHIVAEHARRRELLALHHHLGDAAQDPGGRSVAEILADTESSLLRISDVCARDRAGPRAVSASLRKIVQGIEDRYENMKPVVGLATGYLDLDDLTTGLHPGNLIILGARPSMGKTALAMNIAEHAAMEGSPVLFISLEMSEEELTLRLLASIGSINLQTLRTGRMEGDDWPRMTHAVTTLHNAPLYIDDQPALSVAEIRATARRMATNTGLGLIVVDYLGLMAGEGETQTLRVGAMANGIKAVAKELKVPVLLLSQLNRGLENRPDKRPNLADLRDSGEIEQTADMVWFLYRDEVYNQESMARGTAELIVAKQRNGPTATVLLTFRGQYGRFENHHPEIYPDHRAK